MHLGALQGTEIYLGALQGALSGGSVGRQPPRTTWEGGAGGAGPPQDAGRPAAGGPPADQRPVYI